MLKLRAVVPEDAEVACEVFDAHDPDEPQDPDVTRHRWSVNTPDFVRERFLLEADGRAVGFAFRGHRWWDSGEGRFAFNDLRLVPAAQDRVQAAQVMDRLESANVEEGAETLVARTREGFEWDIDLLEERGYRYDRLSKAWELDLEANRERLLGEREAARAAMREQGIDLGTQDADGDPELIHKLHRLNDETTHDIPTTVPHHRWSLAEFKMWGESPEYRGDRSWIARDGDQVVAWSFLKYPRRGRVWTGYTCCARSHRGRGIARAVKMETLGQAIELGVSSVRTDNDEANAPMLHINETLGYHRIPGFVVYLKDVS